ncbi:MAG: DNRLRE domain-containing protein, partial [Chloroflexales bacterium]|nr:DNRLRE domain-containing protein [Chloroflexales bacterium]
VGGLPNVVERYAVLANGLKHDVVLTARPSGLQGAAFAHRSLLRLSPGLRLFANGREQRGAFATSGAIELRDTAGDTRMRIEPPFAYEQADMAHERSIALTYRVGGTGAARSLSLEVSADWLNDAARAYPVVLDPTTTVEIGDNDSVGLDMVIADNPNEIGGQTGETSTTRGLNLVKRDITRSGMFTPTQAQRSLLKFALDPQLFNTSPISVTRINTATFQLSFAQYVNNSNCSSVPAENLSQNVELYRLTRDWDGNARWNTPWVTPGGDVATPALDARDVPPTSGQGSIFNWNATAAVQGWVSGSIPNNGLLLKLRDELAYNKCGIAFYSSNAGDTNGTPVGHPRLLIDYTAAAKGVDVQIISPPKQYADAGGAIQYIARVTPNSITSGTFDLAATSGVPAWTVGGLPASVTVSAGQPVDVPFTVTVPTSGAAPGDTQITRVTATLSGVPQVSDFAEVQSQVRLDTPDLRLQMRRAPAYVVAPGDLVTYTLVYSSYFREVSNAVLTDTLPDSSLVDIVSFTTGGVTSTVGARIRITWAPENVSELTTMTKQVVVRVKPTAPLYVRFDNSAEVAGSPADRPEYARDNSVTMVTATGRKLYLPLIGTPQSLFVP